MRGSDVTPALAALWENHFGAAAADSVVPDALGGNNRVTLLDDGSRRAVAKHYLAESGGADRLDVEWRFLTYARTLGLDCVPAPLARDPAALIALYGYCPGRRLAEVDASAVIAAGRLFRSLNSGRNRAHDLADAAESRFTLAGQCALLDQRIEALAAASGAEALVREMTDFWPGLRRRLSDGYAALGLDADAALAPAQRCLSPSDFGFHNALRDEAGAHYFVDFEYAGWDDPAKMICDFFLQPALPVPETFRPLFLGEALADWPERDLLIARSDLLQPLFALKWCCIMLNPFLPDRARRALFADPTLDLDDLRRRRLATATTAFTALTGS